MMLNNFGEGSTGYNTHGQDNSKESLPQPVEPSKQLGPGLEPPSSWGYSSQLDGFYNGNLGCYTGNHQGVYSMDQYKANGKYTLQQEYGRFPQYPGGTLHHPIPLKCPTDMCCQHLSEPPRYPLNPPPTFQFSSHHIQPPPRYTEYASNGSKQYLYGKREKTISCNSGFPQVHSDYQVSSKYSHPVNVRQKEMKEPKPSIKSHCPVYPVSNTYWTPRGWMPPPPAYHQSVPLQYKSNQLQESRMSESMHCSSFQSLDQNMPNNQERKGVIMNGPSNSAVNIKQVPEYQPSQFRTTDCFELSSPFMTCGFPSGSNRIPMTNSSSSMHQLSSHSNNSNSNNNNNNNNNQCQVADKQLAQPQAHMSHFNQAQAHETDPAILSNDCRRGSSVTYALSSGEQLYSELRHFDNHPSVMPDSNRENGRNSECIQQSMSKKRQDIDVRQFLATWDDEEEDSTRMSNPATPVTLSGSTGPLVDCRNIEEESKVVEKNGSWATLQSHTPKVVRSLIRKTDVSGKQMIDEDNVSHVIGKPIMQNEPSSRNNNGHGNDRIIDKPMNDIAVCSGEKHVDISSGYDSCFRGDKSSQMMGDGQFHSSTFLEPDPVSSHFAPRHHHHHHHLSAHPSRQPTYATTWSHPNISKPSGGSGHLHLMESQQSGPVQPIFSHSLQHYEKKANVSVVEPVPIMSRNSSAMFHDQTELNGHKEHSPLERLVNFYGDARRHVDPPYDFVSMPPERYVSRTNNRICTVKQTIHNAQLFDGKQLQEFESTSSGIVCDTSNNVLKFVDNNRGNVMDMKSGNIRMKVNKNVYESIKQNSAHHGYYQNLIPNSDALISEKSKQPLINYDSKSVYMDISSNKPVNINFDNKTNNTTTFMNASGSPKCGENADEKSPYDSHTSVEQLQLAHSNCSNNDNDTNNCTSSLSTGAMIMASERTDTVFESPPSNVLLHHHHHHYETDKNGSASTSVNNSSPPDSHQIDKRNDMIITLHSVGECHLDTNTQIAQIPIKACPPFVQQCIKISDIDKNREDEEEEVGKCALKEENEFVRNIQNENCNDVPRDDETYVDKMTAKDQRRLDDGRRISVADNVDLKSITNSKDFIEVVPTSTDSDCSTILRQTIVDNKVETKSMDNTSISNENILENPVGDKDGEGSKSCSVLVNENSRAQLLLHMPSLEDEDDGQEDKDNEPVLQVNRTNVNNSSPVKSEDTTNGMQPLISETSGSRNSVYFDPKDLLSINSAYDDKHDQNCKISSVNNRTTIEKVIGDNIECEIEKSLETEHSILEGTHLSVSELKKDVINWNCKNNDANSIIQKNCCLPQDNILSKEVDSEFLMKELPSLKMGVNARNTNGEKLVHEDVHLFDSKKCMVHETQPLLDKTMDRVSRVKVLSENSQADILKNIENNKSHNIKSTDSSLSRDYSNENIQQCDHSEVNDRIVFNTKCSDQNAIKSQYSKLHNDKKDLINDLNKVNDTVIVSDVSKNKESSNFLACKAHENTAKENCDLKKQDNSLSSSTNKLSSEEKRCYANVEQNYNCSKESMPNCELGDNPNSKFNNCSEKTVNIYMCNTMLRKTVINTEHHIANNSLLMRKQDENVPINIRTEVPERSPLKVEQNHLKSIVNSEVLQDRAEHILNENEVMSGSKLHGQDKHCANKSKEQYFESNDLGNKDKLFSTFAGTCDVNLMEELDSISDNINCVKVSTDSESDLLKSSSDSGEDDRKCYEEMPVSLPSVLLQNCNAKCLPDTECFNKELNFKIGGSQSVEIPTDDEKRRNNFYTFNSTSVIHCNIENSMITDENLRTGREKPIFSLAETFENENYKSYSLPETRLDYEIIKKGLRRAVSNLEFKSFGSNVLRDERDIDNEISLHSLMEDSNSSIEKSDEPYQEVNLLSPDGNTLGFTEDLKHKKSIDDDRTSEIELKSLLEREKKIESNIFDDPNDMLESLMKHTEEKIDCNHTEEQSDNIGPEIIPSEIKSSSDGKKDDDICKAIQDAQNTQDSIEIQSTLTKEAAGFIEVDSTDAVSGEKDIVPIEDSREVEHFNSENLAADKSNLEDKVMNEQSCSYEIGQNKLDEHLQDEVLPEKRPMSATEDSHNCTTNSISSKEVDKQELITSDVNERNQKNDKLKQPEESNAVVGSFISDGKLNFPNLKEQDQTQFIPNETIEQNDDTIVLEQFEQENPTEENCGKCTDRRESHTEDHLNSLGNHVLGEINCSRNGDKEISLMCGIHKVMDQQEGIDIYNYPCIQCKSKILESIDSKDLEASNSSDSTNNRDYPFLCNNTKETIEDRGEHETIDSEKSVGNVKNHSSDLIAKHVPKENVEKITDIPVENIEVTDPNVTTDTKESGSNIKDQSSACVSEHVPEENVKEVTDSNEAIEVKECEANINDHSSDHFIFKNVPKENVEHITDFNETTDPAEGGDHVKDLSSDFIIEDGPEENVEHVTDSNETTDSEESEDIVKDHSSDFITINVPEENVEHVTDSNETTDSEESGYNVQDPLSHFITKDVPEENVEHVTDSNETTDSEENGDNVKEHSSEFMTRNVPEENVEHGTDSNETTDSEENGDNVKEHSSEFITRNVPEENVEHVTDPNDTTDSEENGDNVNEHSSDFITRNVPEENVEHVTDSNETTDSEESGDNVKDHSSDFITRNVPEENVEHVTDSNETTDSEESGDNVKDHSSDFITKNVPEENVEKVTDSNETTDSEESGDNMKDHSLVVISKYAPKENVEEVTDSNETTDSEESGYNVQDPLSHFITKDVPEENFNEIIGSTVTIDLNSPNKIEGIMRSSNYFVSIRQDIDDVDSHYLGNADDVDQINKSEIIRPIQHDKSINSEYTKFNVLADNVNIYEDTENYFTDQTIVPTNLNEESTNSSSVVVHSVQHHSSIIDKKDNTKVNKLNSKYLNNISRAVMRSKIKCLRPKKTNYLFKTKPRFLNNRFSICKSKSYIERKNINMRQISKNRAKKKKRLWVERQKKSSKDTGTELFGLEEAQGNLFLNGLDLNEPRCTKNIDENVENELNNRSDPTLSKVLLSPGKCEEDKECSREERFENDITKTDSSTSEENSHSSVDTKLNGLNNPVDSIISKVLLNSGKSEENEERFESEATKTDSRTSEENSQSSVDTKMNDLDHPSDSTISKVLLNLGKYEENKECSREERFENDMTKTDSSTSEENSHSSVDIKMNDLNNPVDSTIKKVLLNPCKCEENKECSMEERFEHDVTKTDSSNSEENSQCSVETKMTESSSAEDLSSITSSNTSSETDTSNDCSNSLNNKATKMVDPTDSDVSNGAIIIRNLNCDNRDERNESVQMSNIIDLENKRSQIIRGRTLPSILQLKHRQTRVKKWFYMKNTFRNTNLLKRIRFYKENKHLYLKQKINCILKQNKVNHGSKINNTINLSERKIGWDEKRQEEIIVNNFTDKSVTLYCEDNDRNNNLNTSNQNSFLGFEDCLGDNVGNTIIYDDSQPVVNIQHDFQNDYEVNSYSANDSTIAWNVSDDDNYSENEDQGAEMRDSDVSESEASLEKHDLIPEALLEKKESMSADLESEKDDLIPDPLLEKGDSVTDEHTNIVENCNYVISEDNYAKDTDNIENVNDTSSFKSVEVKKSKCEECFQLQSGIPKCDNLETFNGISLERNEIDKFEFENYSEIKFLNNSSKTEIPDHFIVNKANNRLNTYVADLSSDVPGYEHKLCQNDHNFITNLDNSLYNNDNVQTYDLSDKCINREENMVEVSDTKDSNFEVNDKVPLLGVDNTNSIVIIIEEICNSESQQYEIHIEDENSKNEVGNKEEDIVDNVVCQANEEGDITDGCIETQDNFVVNSAMDDLTVTEVELAYSGEVTCPIEDDICIGLVENANNDLAHDSNCCECSKGYSSDEESDSSSVVSAGSKLNNSDGDKLPNNISGVNKQINIISISPTINEESNLGPRPVVRCSLPWERIFNISNSKRRKFVSKRHNTNGIELGPAKIEFRIGNYPEDVGAWKVVGSSPSNNTCISPVVKVKRLILQRDPELTSYSEDSTSPKSESSSEEELPPKMQKQSEPTDVRESNSSSEDSLLPKVLIKKMEKSKYKSFLKLPNVTAPLVKLKRSKFIDEMALKSDKTINLKTVDVGSLLEGQGLVGKRIRRKSKVSSLTRRQSSLKNRHKNKTVSSEVDPNFRTIDEEKSSVSNIRENLRKGISTGENNVSIKCSSSSSNSVDEYCARNDLFNLNNSNELDQEVVKSIRSGCISNTPAASINALSRRLSRSSSNEENDDDSRSGCMDIQDADRPARDRALKRHSDEQLSESESLKKKPSHVSEHMFHCQRCMLVFNNKEEVISHQATRHPSHRERHHCMLCQRSFSSLSHHSLHVQSRNHRRLELLQRCTIHAMHRYFTGQDCPRLYPLTPVELKSLDWRPSQPGCIHFYHHPSPLQLALQENPWGANTKMNDKASVSSKSSSQSTVSSSPPASSLSSSSSSFSSSVRTSPFHQTVDHLEERRHLIESPVSPTTSRSTNVDNENDNYSLS